MSSVGNQDIVNDTSSIEMQPIGNVDEDDDDEETSRKEIQERLQHLEKEAFQLSNYYFVFQGVVFTAFYHEPHLKCKYFWIPFTLSILAGILNAGALGRIGWRYMNTLNEADRDAIDGGDVDGDGGEPITVIVATWWRCFYYVCCILIVVLFLLVTLAGCFIISCTDDN